MKIFGLNYGSTIATPTAPLCVVAKKEPTLYIVGGREYPCEILFKMNLQGKWHGAGLKDGNMLMNLLKLNDTYVYKYCNARKR